jgi:hypothetical protein
LKKQQQRRERHERRIFKTEDKKLILDPEDRLLKARQKTFLFTQDQSLRKRIRHLKYRKLYTKIHILEPRHYLIEFPFFILHKVIKTTLKIRPYMDVLTKTSSYHKSNPLITILLIHHQLPPHYPLLNTITFPIGIDYPLTLKSPLNTYPLCPINLYFLIQERLTTRQDHMPGINTFIEHILQIKIANV